MSNTIEIQKEFLLSVLNRTPLPDERYLEQIEDCLSPCIAFNNGYKENVATFSLEDTTCDVADKILVQKTRIGVVTTPSSKVVGTIGKTDLIRGIIKTLRDKTADNLCDRSCDCAQIKANELMKDPFEYVRESEYIYKAIIKMNKQNMERIIMLNKEDHLAGLLDRKELAAKFQEMWISPVANTDIISEGFALLLFKEWVKNHPYAYKSFIKDSDGEYSPNDILKEMEIDSSLGRTYRKNYKEEYNKVLKERSAKGESVDKIMTSLVNPPIELDKMKEIYEIFMRERVDKVDESEE